MSAPLDVTLDRRSFLTRMAALTAAATAGGVLASPPTAAQVPVLATGWRDDLLRRLSRPEAYAQSVRPEALADPTECTIAEAAELIRRGRLTPVALMEAYLDRIARFDGTYKAFNTVLADAALAAAVAASGRRPISALDGIALAVKDNYFTAGVPTTANSFIFQDFVPPSDATAVARLTSAGAIVIGKTQMGPLATTRATTPTGQVTTVNAWTPASPSVNPGGSSTGSATATAGRLATTSIGTQTGGSITGPSNAQNLTGLKPTMGRASLNGIIPLTYTRDHPGPLARDAKDAALVLTAMAGPDPADPRSLGLPPLPDLLTAATPLSGGRPGVRWPTRVGVIPGFTAGTSETVLARRAMLDQLAATPGVTVVDVTLPEEWSLLTGGPFNNVRLPERTEPFLAFLREDLKLFGVSLGSWVQGLFLSGDEFLRGQRAKQVLLERVLFDLFAQCDVVVQTSPVPFDIIGLPEIAFPIGFTSSGVPIGTILGGLPYAEDRLLAVVAAYQAVTDWHLRRPPDPAVPMAPLAAARSASAGPVAEPSLVLTAEDAIEQSQ
jgi:Asp-tRNA(Asn)/Glu-tRNA(Gln) amidotransferase A subunit family amidase